MLRISFLRWRQLLLSWHNPLALALAALIVFFPDYESIEWLYRRIIWMEVSVASALLGLLLTGISITLSLMRDELLFLLSRQGSGLREEMWPFWITALFAMVGIFSGIVSVALFAEAHCIWVRRISIGFVTFFSALAVLSVLEIIKLLVSYAEIRVLYHENRSYREPDDSSSETP